MPKTNILVTGGAGFIGSHLVEALLDRNAEVTVFDKSYGPKSYFVLNNFTKKTTVIKIDLRDKNKLFAAIKKNTPDCIFHLAAQTIVTESYQNPVETLESNIMGTAYILEAVRNNPKIKGVIVASSDKAYGKMSEAKSRLPCKGFNRDKYHESTPLKGDHPYDISKSSCDLIAQTYFKTYHTPVVITRFGNVYGEGDLHFNRIIPGICEAIIKKKTLEIRSNGKYIRDYLYVKDVVNGYMLLLANFEKVKGEAFNFGSQETLSVLDLISKIEKTLKVKINYKILNCAQNEIPYQSLDYGKIKKTLGWEPKQTVAKTIEKIYQWYTSNSF